MTEQCTIQGMGLKYTSLPVLVKVPAALLIRTPPARPRRRAVGGLRRGAAAGARRARAAGALRPGRDIPNRML
eukprot:gene17332-biopygen800